MQPLANRGYCDLLHLKVLGLCAAALVMHAASAEEPTRMVGPTVTPVVVDASAVPAIAPVDVVDFVVRGNTVLSEAQIDEALYPFLGTQKTGDDLEKARAALENAYSSHGFKTVSVLLPPQTPSAGVVLLEVTEGRVGHLKVVGSKYSAIDKIKRNAPSLAEGSVPDFNQVPVDISALNQLSDRRVTPELKAGVKPGTVDVDLDVVDHLPLHGSLEINNRRSQDTTPLRTSASLSYDDLWQAGHSLSLSAQVDPQKTSDARVFYGAYLARFGASPWSLLVSGTRSNSNVATIGGTDVLGNGTTVSTQAMLTLTATDTFYQALSFGIAYKHFNNTTSAKETQGGLPVVQIDKVPLVYLPFTIGYTTIWRSRTSVTQGDLSLSFANPRWGSSQAEFDENRFDATGQELYLRGSLTHTHDLPGGLQGFIRVSGQITDQPLANTEQYVAGGADTVRGYLEAEALGDVGAGGTLELRSPSLAQWISFGSVRPVDEWRFFIFGDDAYLRLRDPLPEQRDAFRLASYGAGFNLKVYSYFNANFTWADPIFNATATHRRASRYLFRVWTSF
jgi:hemolysin activation/secretion protein